MNLEQRVYDILMEEWRTPEQHGDIISGKARHWARPQHRLTQTKARLKGDAAKVQREIRVRRQSRLEKGGGIGKKLQRAGRAIRTVFNTRRAKNQADNDALAQTDQNIKVDHGVRTQVPQTPEQQRMKTGHKVIWRRK